MVSFWHESFQVVPLSPVDVDSVLMASPEQCQLEDPLIDPKGTGIVHVPALQRESAVGVHSRYMVALKDRATSPQLAGKLMAGLSLVLLEVTGGYGYWLSSSGFELVTNPFGLQVCEPLLVTIEILSLLISCAQE